LRLSHLGLDVSNLVHGGRHAGQFHSGVLPPETAPMSRFGIVMIRSNRSLRRDGLSIVGCDPDHLRQNEEGVDNLGSGLIHELRISSI
jgi:hypothetical protein